ncbi:MAG: preprotein translocase subunit YajC [Hespellia sp.]|nr:preprotein translocase subunit YajC [Hespellia sp.]
MLISLIIILFFVVTIYFSLVRPERNRAKKKAVMLNTVTGGVIVYTVDGIRGKVDRLEGMDMTLSCYPDDTMITFNLEAVQCIEDYDEKSAKAKMKEKIKNARVKKR